MSMTVNGPKPVFPTEAQDTRARAVSAKLAELAQAAGLDLEHPENWKEKEVALRNRLLDEAEGSVAGSKPTLIVGPKEYAFDADPITAINRAKRALADAQVARDAAAEVFARATARMEGAEAELSGFADLDEKVEDHHVLMLRENRAPDLSATLRHRLEARASARERFDGAIAAHARLAREAEVAGVAVQAAERTIRAAASAFLMWDAEQIVDDLEELEKSASEHRAILLSLGASWLPGLHGPLPLPPKVINAINTPPKAAEPRQSLIDMWRQRHEEIVSADIVAKPAATRGKGKNVR